ncbi:Tm-1-like ATP-binding domain-containing protein [Bradyrhizobium sp. Ec3.3]|uniref:Tm-1-like ATP-binding domain-containing protein n=1 Tax=Bradyrhizobium sp. Ec3.3 TaxID=189753 RepID=UPI0012EB40EA|nr:Tm-1-like ATP-binding domain-containing protein [Bradyrhizobium sp. Ec3.3]
MSRCVYIAGTADTKGHELSYVRDLVAAERFVAQIVDLSTLPHAIPVDIAAADVARHHPGGLPSYRRSWFGRPCNGGCV